MRNIKAVFTKQLLSYLKNPGMWGAPASFLLLVFVFLVLVPEIDMALISAQFTVMFVGISMIGVSGAFIAEDRLTMNLRFMGMAGVKPYQYMIGTCGALLLISFGTLILFGLMGLHSGQALINFLIVSMLGAASSMLLGVTLSLSKAAPFSPIAGMLLGVGPMFSEANEVLSRIFSFVYTQHVTDALREDLVAGIPDLQVVLINMAIIVAAFIVINFRNGLDGEKIKRS